MKKFRRLLTVTAIAAFLLIATAVSASAVENSFVMSDTAYNGQVVVNWNYTPYSSNAKVIGFNLYDRSGKKLNSSLFSPSAKSATITGFSAGYVDRWELEAVYTLYGNQYTSSQFTYVNTIPAKFSTKNFGLSGVTSKSASFAAQMDYNKMSGTNLQLYSVSPSSLKKTLKSTSTYYSSTSVSKNKAYKYRVRSYYTNSSNGKTYYGPWSNFRYFDNIKTSYSTSSKVKGCKLKLKGVKGVVAYKVYVSSKSSSKGKLVKTCKPKVGKTKYYRIDKCGGKYMKKGKSYYVRVYPIIKTGGKKYSSDVYGKFNFYNYK